LFFKKVFIKIEIFAQSEAILGVVTLRAFSRIIYASFVKEGKSNKAN